MYVCVYLYIYIYIAYTVMHVGKMSSDTNGQDVTVVSGDEQEGDPQF